MSSGQRNVLFFGSLSAAIVGQEVRNKALVDELEKQNALLKLRLTATAASYRTEEVLGAVSTSAPFSAAAPKPDVEGPDSGSGGGMYPLRRRCPFFLPLMLELAQDLAADGLPSEIDSEADEAEGDGAASPASASSSSGSPTSAAAAAAKAKAKTKSKAGAKASEDAGYYAVTVNISTDVARGSSRAIVVRSKRVVLPSLSKHAARDTCSIVRIALSSRLLTRSATASNLGTEEVEKEVADGDTALVVYVLLRVADLSERVSAAEDAVDDVRRLLGLPPPIPRLSLALTKRVVAPYGVMPLPELCKHYRLFYSQYYSKVLKPSKEVEHMLADGTPGLREANKSYPHRWNALEEVRLDRVLLGDEGLAPLLLTLAHCTNLRCLVADRNGLGDISCARLCALFSRHRYLRSLSLAHNNIYEGGADLLLRLARRNHRLNHIDLSGNWCSEAVRQRVAAVTAGSWQGIAADPLNVFAEQYGYLASPASIPVVTLKLALTVWAMLTAAPVGDVDVWIHNSTTKDMDQYVDESTSLRLRASKAAAKSPLSVIPPAARAPLLSEVMRTVYVGVCMAVPDPLVRSVFVDLEEARQRRLQALRGRDADSDDSDDSAEDGGGVAEGGELPPDVAAALGIAPPSGKDREKANGKGVAAVLADSEDEIYNASFLKIVVTTMRAIASGSPWEEVEAVLRGIGNLHRSLGVRIEDYWLAVHVFVKGLSVCLGTEDFTSDRLAAFLIVLALGVRTVASANSGAVPTL